VRCNVCVSASLRELGCANARVWECALYLSRQELIRTHRNVHIGTYRWIHTDLNALHACTHTDGRTHSGPHRHTGMDNTFKEARTDCSTHTAHAPERPSAL